MLSLITLFGICMSCNWYWALVDMLGKEAHEGLKSMIYSKYGEVVHKKTIKFYLTTSWPKDTAVNEHYNFIKTAKRNNNIRKKKKKRSARDDRQKYPGYF